MTDHLLERAEKLRVKFVDDVMALDLAKTLEMVARDSAVATRRS